MLLFRFVCFSKVMHAVDLQIHFKRTFLKFSLNGVNEYGNGEEIKKSIFLNIDASILFKDLLA